MEYIEMWDWETGRPSGTSVERKAAHRNGVAHEGVHLWIYRLHEGELQLVLQRRSMKKDLYPGYYDISVGGHVPFGYSEGKIQKESAEELGVILDDAAMHDLGYFRYHEDVPSMNLYHREFQRVYVARLDLPLDSYVFDDGEVDAVCAISLGLFTQMLSGEDVFAECEVFDGAAIGFRRISAKDLHPLFFSPVMRPYLDVVVSAVRASACGREVAGFPEISGG